MAWYHPKTLFDKTYEVGIIIKGIDGLFELLGGLVLLLVSPHTFGRLATWLTHGELDQDPHDFIAVHILHTGQQLAAGRNWFAIAFLLTHGIVKVVLVVALLRNKLWAYPFAFVALGLFLVYQVYELVLQVTAGMALLTVLDVIIIWLVWREWQKVKAEGFPGQKPS